MSKSLFTPAYSIMSLVGIFLGIVGFMDVCAHAQPAAIVPPSLIAQSAAQATNSSPGALSPTPSTLQSSYLEPGWRSAPNTTLFPLNPFSVGTSVVSTPHFYEQETKMLAQRIRGLMRIGTQYALLMDNQLIREGMKVSSVAPSQKTKKDSASVLTRKSAQESNNPALDPKMTFFVFSGVAKDRSYAIFKIDTIEIEVPLPSVNQKLHELTGSLEPMRRASTAFLLGYEGYFITSAQAMPDVNTTQKISIKTQAGFFPALILKKHPQTQLALGRIEGSIHIALPTWNLAGDLKESPIALAFDPASTQSFSRPSLQHIQSQTSNPRWLIGAPLFEKQKLVGLLGEKNNKLALYSYPEILNIFPELSAADAAARAKTEPPASLPAATPAFFNPEQYLGAVYLYQ